MEMQRINNDIHQVFIDIVLFLSTDSLLQFYFTEVMMSKVFILFPKFFKNIKKLYHMESKEDITTIVIYYITIFALLVRKGLRPII